MSKIRYMVEYIYSRERAEQKLYPYLPAGVWAISDSQFDTAILEDRFPQRAEELHWFHVKLAEKDSKPWRVDGYLEYWQESRSPYRGSFGDIQEVEGDNLREVIERVMKTIRASWASGKWTD